MLHYIRKGCFSDLYRPRDRDQKPLVMPRTFENYSRARLRLTKGSEELRKYCAGDPDRQKVRCGMFSQKAPAEAVGKMPEEKRLKSSPKVSGQSDIVCLDFRFPTSIVTNFTTNSVMECSKFNVLTSAQEVMDISAQIRSYEYLESRE